MVIVRSGPKEAGAVVSRLVFHKNVRHATLTSKKDTASNMVEVGGSMYAVEGTSLEKVRRY